MKNSQKSEFRQFLILFVFFETIFVITLLIKFFWGAFEYNQGFPNSCINTSYDKPPLTTNVFGINLSIPNFRSIVNVDNGIFFCKEDSNPLVANTKVLLPYVFNSSLLSLFIAGIFYLIIWNISQPTTKFKIVIRYIFLIGFIILGLLSCLVILSIFANR